LFSQGAQELTAVIWGQELVYAPWQYQNILGDVGDEDDGGGEKVYMFGVRLKWTLTEVWKNALMNMFDTP
jgi:hypothetical protein